MNLCIWRSAQHSEWRATARSRSRATLLQSRSPRVFTSWLAALLLCSPLLLEYSTSLSRTLLFRSSYSLLSAIWLWIINAFTWADHSLLLPPPSSRGVGLVNRELHPAAHGTPCTFFYSHRICFWRLVDSRDRSRSNKSLPLESGLLLSLFTNRLLRTFNSLTFSYLCQFSELRISILYVCISRPSLSSSSFFLRNPSFLFTNSKFILYFWFAKISIYGPFQINLRYHAVSCRQIHNLF